ncbi:MAG: nuclear transport factor 2 family protein [Acidimicrobiales bacterium]
MSDKAESINVDPNPDTEQNRTLVTEVFGQFVAGNARPFFDLVAHDVRWTVIGSTAISGTFESKRDFFTEAMGKLTEGLAAPISGTIRQISADGDRVIIQWEGGAPTKSGGQYSQTYCWVLRLNGGMIVEAMAYLDTEMVNSVFDRTV